jgi:hypothetical protein
MRTYQQDRDLEPMDPFQDSFRLAADLLVFAPLGLVLSARTAVPDLIERGRKQVQSANTIGKFVVPIARRRLKRSIDEFLGGAKKQTGTANTATSRTTTLQTQGVAVRPVEAPKTRSSKLASLDPNLDPTLSPKVAVVGEPPVGGPAEAPASTASSSVGNATQQSGRHVASDGRGDLGIESYDMQPAQTILALLEGLTADQLTAVETYEQAHRARRTILYGVSAQRSNRE